MIKFKIALSSGRDKIIDECLLEIIDHNEEENREYQMFTIDLNRQEVKQLLDLMKEAYNKLGKHKDAHTSPLAKKTPNPNPK
jgi:hypothetical protein